MPNEELISEEKEVAERIERVCNTCRWWTRERPQPGTVETWGLEMFPFGECRQSPPTALPGDRRFAAVNDVTGELFVNIKLARFPHTYPQDWCGGWDERAKVE